ncbi:glycosyltransferase [Gaiella sp.]|jgi:glycosyltransferase involved in cell wall biosynthesis|uniref:glycosyltransferase n=1 Tax=Gaiella sp. TaxID=2663207 RepID=UPI002E33AD06|nr:galactosyltransferase-related protein [Gaiella sp.]HEX5582443.1 galactosyltransferase-related protein [Gaiella sp.]
MPRAVSRPRLAFVVSTYEAPRPLDAVLRGFAEQSDRDFELVVADDGSGPDTKAVVDDWRSTFASRLTHVWQPDEGFRLARVMNLGALAVDADYLVFLHGESIPRRRLVRAIRTCMKPGWFVAGRRVNLSRQLTARVLEQELPVHRWGLPRWIRARAVGNIGELAALTDRDRRRVGKVGVPEFVPRNRSYGYLLGVERGYFERVNGYDTRFVGWGEEDVDIALRLGRLGLRCGQPGPDGTLIHLWHESNVPRERPNWYLLQETERSDRIDAIEGLREQARAARGGTGWLGPGGTRRLAV